MLHPYSALKPELSALLARAHIDPKRDHELSKACAALLDDKAIYERITAKTGVPEAFLMATAMREMSGSLHCYLGNGQSLKRKTTIVPIGRGPFLQKAPEDFIAGALDALHIDGLDKIASTPEGWTMERAAYEAETFNGFGYRAKGIPSPYVWGATTVQRPGKFIRDHVYDSSVMDPQLGVIAIIDELIKLDPKLAFSAIPAKIDVQEGEAPIVPFLPVGIGGGINVFLLQEKLNSLHVSGTPLKVDGIYGRATTRAVKSFQFIAKLADVDGFVGPKTKAALAL